MICVDYNCDKCKHQRPNIDGWKCACNAFPDGIPHEYLFTSKKPEEMVNCNNGIGFEQVIGSGVMICIRIMAM